MATKTTTTTKKPAAKTTNTANTGMATFKYDYNPLTYKQATQQAGKELNPTYQTDANSEYQQVS